MITTRAVPTLPADHRHAARPTNPRRTLPAHFGVRHHLHVDRSELLTALDCDGINPNTYSLDGGHPPERYVLAHQPGGWSVYYSERGLETGRADFGAEDEACRHLLQLLRSDQATHFHLVAGPLPAAEADAAFQTWKKAHGLTSSDALDPSDVRIDNPVFTAAEGPVRRYWIRGTKLPGRCEAE
jgi:hypothetical protein